MVGGMSSKEVESVLGRLPELRVLDLRNTAPICAGNWQMIHVHCRQLTALRLVCNPACLRNIFMVAPPKLRVFHATVHSGGAPLLEFPLQQSGIGVLSK